MTPEQQVDYMLADCFVAAGRAVGNRAQLGYDAITWWRDRYRDKFAKAITLSGNCWHDDRDRLLGVSQFLGHRAVQYVGETRCIDRACAARASEDIEAGCRLRAQMQNACVPTQPPQR